MDAGITVTGLSPVQRAAIPNWLNGLRICRVLPSDPRNLVVEGDCDGESFILKFMPAEDPAPNLELLQALVGALLVAGASDPFLSGHTYAASTSEVRCIVQRNVGIPYLDADEVEIRELGSLLGRFYHAASTASVSRFPLAPHTVLRGENWQRALRAGARLRSFVPPRQRPPVELTSTLVHGDLRLCNVLRGDAGPTLVDFDEAGRGIPEDDLGRFLQDIIYSCGCRDKRRGAELLSAFADSYDHSPRSELLIRAFLYNLDRRLCEDEATEGDAAWRRAQAASRTGLAAIWTIEDQSVAKRAST